MRARHVVLRIEKKGRSCSIMPELFESDGETEAA